MILLTDISTFAGQAILRRLVAERRAVRCLLQPSRRELRLPTGVTVATVATSWADLPALRTGLLDVTTVIHVVGDFYGDPSRSLAHHPQETANLLLAMQETGVERLIYISRFGAEQASAYSILRIHGETEALIRQAQPRAAILQPTITYGHGDLFTHTLAMFAKLIPFVFPVPNAGLSRFQPLWVEDLAMATSVALDDDRMAGKTLPLGGPEYFTLPQIVGEILAALRVRRTRVQASLPMVRLASQLLETLMRRNPLPLWMLEVLTAGSATELDVVPRLFGFEPSRLAHSLSYLGEPYPWRREFARFALELS
ncbi:MAG: NAD(P)H-binding protein [Anaerolineales bacterium]|nr:NAD(P)H-binding protein [Anaerolineales bacterium]